ncbi:uncharacterized protein LOC135394457 [Ornithodoros turicata]|uniref:uncharacterized protein LOC135394457 n=1 Tax=Ornithodoros turicata TaxID=34597 RepID=UPI0031393A46
MASSRAGGTGAQGLSTPETSSSAEALEDEHQPSGENKRKKFHPFRAVRKIFRWKVKRQATPQEVVGPSKKSRSTGELQSVPDDEQRLKVAAVAPYSIGLSVSHDSVFTSDTASALGDTQELSQGSSLSVNRNSHKLMFRDELFTRVQARRDSDDDDIGLPHSPCTSPTTADVLSRGLQAKSSKPHSTCSAGSLSSMFSSENDEDPLGQAVHDRRGDAANGDNTESFPLSHKAALHKISVKPKRTHALPRNRRLQMLSAAPPSNLPATPEVSEDCTRLVSIPTETVDTEHKHPEASSTSCSSTDTSVPSEPILPPHPEEQRSPETKMRKSSDAPHLGCSTPVAPDPVKELEDRTTQETSESIPIEQSPVGAIPAHVCDFSSHHLRQNDDSCSISEMTVEDEQLQAVPESQISKTHTTTVSVEVKQVDDESSTKNGSKFPKQPKDKHIAGKPKAAELKLLHEIAQFNKRQEEMEKKMSPTECNGVRDEEAVVDVREAIQSLEALAQQGDSKMTLDEVQEEQRKLDLLNGNVSADSDKDCQITSLSQKVPSCVQQENESLLEHSLQLKLTSPPKKIPSANDTDCRETQAPHSPFNKRNEAHRRYSCMEPISANRSKPAEIQRPLSVEIIPFNQRKKDSSPSPPPIKGDSSPKKEEKNDLFSTEQNLVGESTPEKLPMSYPVHFRIYKGRRKSLVGDEKQNQGQESLPLGPKSWDQTSSFEDKPTTHHFEIKIHSTTDMKDRPEVKSRVPDIREKVELRNTDHNNDGKDQPSQTTEALGSPQRRDDIKPRPFSRGVQVKGIASNNEPELFKVFARRSLKQKHCDKEPNDDTAVADADAATEKTEANPGDMVSVTAAGGTIVKISESSTVITPEHQRGKQQAVVTQNGVSSSEHSKPTVQAEFRSASQISKMFESTAAKGTSVKNMESPVKTVSKAVNMITTDAPAKSTKVPELTGKAVEVVSKNGWQSSSPLTSQLGGQHTGKGTVVANSANESDKDTSAQPRRNHGSRPRYHTSPEVAQEDIVKATTKPRQEPAEKPVTCESPKVSRSLHRASSVSSSSPSSSGSFRINKADAIGLDGQPAWLQLAQQRREMREQRERALLGRPAETSFVIETSKPSRSSKVLDMVSNFQKLQMT